MERRWSWDTNPPPTVHLRKARTCERVEHLFYDSVSSAVVAAAAAAAATALAAAIASC